MPYDAAEWHRRMHEIYRRDIQNKADLPGRDEYGKFDREWYRSVDPHIEDSRRMIGTGRAEPYRHTEQKFRDIEIRSEESVRLERVRKAREAGALE